MNFFKKISVFILTVALSLSLFSFKSTNSNERNLGMAQVAYNSSFNVNSKPKPKPWLRGAAWFIAEQVTGYIVDYALDAYFYTAFTPEAPKNEHEIQYQINNL